MELPRILQEAGILQNWKGRECFVVFLTAFGDGLQFLHLLNAWRSDPFRPERLHLFALCTKALPAGDLVSDECIPRELQDPARQLHALWPPPIPGLHRIELETDPVVLTLGFGTPETLSPQLQANCFLIAPGNPGFPLRLLARFAAPNATLAAADLSTDERASLFEAGFQTNPCPNSGIWIGRLLHRKPHHEARTQRSAIVIGAGLAGTAIAFRLARRGWNTTLIERHPAPASEASGNRAAVFSPMVARDQSRASRLSAACFLHLLREIHQLHRAGFPVEWSGCGVVQLAKSHADSSAMQAIAAGYPESYLKFLDSKNVRTQLGPDLPAYLFPTGGWVHPGSLCNARLAAAGPRLQLCFNQEALRMEAIAGGWLVFGKKAAPLAEAPVLVLANAHDALQLPALHGLRFKKVRGQVTHLPVQLLPQVPHVLTGNGYLTPAHQGICCLGATYDFDTNSQTLEAASHQSNLDKLPNLLGAAISSPDPAGLQGRVGFRTLTPDRLPLAGVLPDFSKPPADELWKTPRLPGLHALLGLGSRGLVWSGLLAELLASQIAGDPLPLENDLIDAIDPARFRVREGRSAAAKTAAHGRSTGVDGTPD